MSPHCATCDHKHLRLTFSSHTKAPPSLSAFLTPTGGAVEAPAASRWLCLLPARNPHHAVGGNFLKQSHCFLSFILFFCCCCDEEIRWNLESCSRSVLFDLQTKFLLESGLSIIQPHIRSPSSLERKRRINKDFLSAELTFFSNLLY